MKNTFLTLALLTLIALANRTCAFAQTVAQTTGEPTKRESITTSTGMKLVLITSGTFAMGNSRNVQKEVEFFATRSHTTVDDHFFQTENPKSHNVTLTNPFYCAINCVTRGEFATFVKETGYKTDAETGGKDGEVGASDWGGDILGGKFEWHKDYSWRNTGFQQTDEHPVVNVSWHDAIAFCLWLSKKEHRTFRLPTEAEWEYVCRAGTTTRYSFGDDPKALTKYANVADESLKKAIPRWEFYVEGESDGYAFTSPVSKFLPNQFGVFDTLGNVSQWCADIYRDDYYEWSPKVNPKGPSKEDVTDDDKRVARGGCWTGAALASLPSRREWQNSHDRSYATGFRVVRER